uniref:BPTI/Kunitz inhibitor domain-containing protein n=1 Tax=Varanus komodoensis TaxID=61221 RepID=A0A8D2L5B4_VARKO
EECRQVSILFYFPLLSAEPCTLPLEEGNCSKYTLNWYYNQRVSECRPFIYSGCRGNLNRFSSKEDCELQCKPQADTGENWQRPARHFFLLVDSALQNHK